MFVDEKWSFQKNRDTRSQKGAIVVQGKSGGDEKKGVFILIEKQLGKGFVQGWHRLTGEKGTEAPARKEEGEKRMPRLTFGWEAACVSGN